MSVQPSLTANSASSEPPTLPGPSTSHPWHLELFLSRLPERRFLTESNKLLYLRPPEGSEWENMIKALYCWCEWRQKILSPEVHIPPAAGIKVASWSNEQVVIAWLRSWHLATLAASHVEDCYDGGELEARKGVFLWHGRPRAVLSLDHPSVTCVGPTEGVSRCNI